MTWMMLICVIPILALLFLGGWSPRGSSWIFPVAIGVFVLGHLWMMFRGHGTHGDDHADHNDEDHKNVTEAGNAESAAPGKKGHSCCH